MSTDDKKHDLSLEERRARLERRAEVIRSRLFRHVDALDARRHQVTEVGRRAKQAAPTAVGVVLASGALVGAGIGLIGWAFRSRKKQLLSYKISKAIAPLRMEKKPSLLGEIGRRLLLTMVTVAATEVARRATKNAFDGRVLGGGIAVPHANGVDHGANGHDGNGVLAHIPALLGAR